MFPVSSIGILQVHLRTEYERRSETLRNRDVARRSFSRGMQALGVSSNTLTRPTGGRDGDPLRPFV